MLIILSIQPTEEVHEAFAKAFRTGLFIPLLSLTTDSTP